MNIAFLSELGFNAKVNFLHPKLRTEGMWMFALQANHFNLNDYNSVKGYDAVFIIFPKIGVNLNAVGNEMMGPSPGFDPTIYSKPVVNTLKNNNKIICVIQEGPHWFFNDYEIITQFNYHNLLSSVDYIFAHNECDINFYKGLFPEQKVNIIPSLMCTNNLDSINPISEQKSIIGGNFCRWGGGFQSYVVASEFEVPIHVIIGHGKRRDEEKIPNLFISKWTMWENWMKFLSTFKYAVHLTPTVAAGSFSLNCAWFGIPCIGNEKIDTQRTLHPDLSVDIENIVHAKELAISLKNDKNFYEKCSNYCKNAVKNSIYSNPQKWKEYMYNILSN